MSLDSVPVHPKLSKNIPKMPGGTSVSTVAPKDVTPTLICMYVVVVEDMLFTGFSESQLSAGYISIHSGEQIITDGAPVVIVTDFNTTFEVASSSTN